MSAPDRPDYGEFNYGEGYYGGPGDYEALIECSEGSSAPLLVTGYDAAREARTTVHDAVDESLVIVLRPARPRAGTLELIFRTADEASHAVDLHAKPVLFTLDHRSLNAVNMRYAVTGRARMTPDPTRLVWHVFVDFQEVGV